MTFALPRAGAVGGPGSAGLVISCPGYTGLFHLGGPLEREGRLRYIDGCSDTLLVSPPRRGDPCLNHLHGPPGTRQSPHTHPSARVGVRLESVPIAVDLLRPAVRAPGGAATAQGADEEVHLEPERDEEDERDRDRTP